MRLLVLLSTALEGCAQFLLLRFRGSPSTAERARWLHGACASALRRLGIDIAAEGRFPSHGLLVANHLSYLDILVFSALSPCVFVSKKEVRSWPLFGLMAWMAGTVFVDRARSTDTHRANTEMSEALSDGAVVVLFPEGTSSNGSSVLPFRPALFEAAIRAGADISSACISYEVEDGSASNDVCYWGSSTFFPHLLRLLSKGKIRSRVRFSAASKRFSDRKLAAQTTQEMVASLAGLRDELGRTGLASYGVQDT
ncbi:MAG: 1-acyl-sn-glycerol-3-phosphate acyltransferase [Acidobacteriia bacterium]|nr:1-acyl-sn-glycerol-3-phosphate acyltransferase [Terriglobia bacterium]